MTKALFFPDPPFPLYRIYPNNESLNYWVFNSFNFISKDLTQEEYDKVRFEEITISIDAQNNLIKTDVNNDYSNQQDYENFLNKLIARYDSYVEQFSQINPNRYAALVTKVKESKSIVNNLDRTNTPPVGVSPHKHIANLGHLIITRSDLY
jgi:hypothetical protein